MKHRGSGSVAVLGFRIPEFKSGCRSGSSKKRRNMKKQPWAKDHAQHCAAEYIESTEAVGETSIKSAVPNPESTAQSLPVSRGARRLGRSSAV